MAKTVGAKDHKPTEAQRAVVNALATVGITQAVIADRLEIDLKTLRKYYRDELDLAKLDKSIAVGNFLLNAATGDAMADGASYKDCLTAAIFWSKTQMGFREKSELDVTSSDGSMSQKPTRIELVAGKNDDSAD